MDSLTGGDLTYTVFDLNGDKNFNDTDTVTVTLPDGTTTKTSVSGLQSGDGMSMRPGMMSAGSYDKAYMTNTSTNCTLINQNACEAPTVNSGPGAHGRQSWRQLR